MTRHREGAELYAGRDDFRGFENLKERLSRARPKDSTLDYTSGAEWRPHAPREQTRNSPCATSGAGTEGNKAGNRSSKQGRAGRSRRTLQAGAERVHSGGRHRRFRSQG